MFSVGVIWSYWGRFDESFFSTQQLMVWNMRKGVQKKNQS
jgi:hypothetical protein